MSKNKFEKVFDTRRRRIRGLWVRNGTYYAQLRLDGSDIASRIPLEDADGNPVKTIPQAITAMHEKKAQRDRGELSVKVVVNASKLTVSEAVDQYVGYLEAMDAKTLKSRQRETTSLKNWKAFCGDKPLGDVDRPTFFKYAEWRKKQKKKRDQANAVSGRCIDCEVSNMMNVLRKFHDDGTLKGECFELKWTPLAKPAAKKRLLPLEEIRKVQQVARDEQIFGQLLSDFLELLRLTGMREQEGYSCRWAGVDWQNNLFTIFQTKNGEPPRHLNMHESLVEFLREMEKRRPRNEDGSLKSDYLFPSPKPGDRGDEPTRNLHKALYKAQKAAGVVEDQGWAFHHLRHYFASWAVMSGIEFTTIAEWLGHKDRGALLCKTYSHLDPKHKANEAKKMSFTPKIVEAPRPQPLDRAA